jgi:hypothetical protein
MASSSSVDSSVKERGATATAAAAGSGPGTMSCAQEVVHVCDVATAFGAVLEAGQLQQPVAVYVIGPGQPPSGGNSKLLQACQSLNMLGSEVSTAYQLLLDGQSVRNGVFVGNQHEI